MLTTGVLRHAHMGNLRGSWGMMSRARESADPPSESLGHLQFRLQSTDVFFWLGAVQAELLTELFDKAS